MPASLAPDPSGAVSRPAASISSSGAAAHCSRKNSQHVPTPLERVGDQTAGDHGPDGMQRRTRATRRCRSCRRRRGSPRRGRGSRRRWRGARCRRPSPSRPTRRLSRARPYFGISQPRPPPSVRPAMPVVPTTPPVVARPWSCVSRLSSFHSTPPCARATCARRVDVDSLHRRQIDHQAVVDRGAAGDVVAAAADGDLEAERARELHGIGDVGRPVAAGDQRRPLVDEPVVHAAGVVIAGIVGLEELTAEALA